MSFVKFSELDVFSYISVKVITSC